MTQSDRKRRNRQSTINHRQSQRALTLIELLVVISIIAVLISVISAASSTLIGRSRSNNTRSVLELVNTAIQQFKAERPAVLRQNYLRRYGAYPPDELEVFRPTGNPIGSQSIAPGGARAFPPPSGPMKFYTIGGGATPNQEHRDLAAMIVAVELFTQEAASILEKIPDRNRSPGALDGGNPPTPTQFLDRDSDDQWDEDDFQIRYIVDDWGVPLGYLAQRDWLANPTPQNPQAEASSNHADWNKASTKMIRMNSGEPILFSWGPDGKEQLTQEAMSDDDNPASLVGDFMKNDDGKIDNVMNADNIYLDAAFAEKLSGQQ